MLHRKKSVLFGFLGLVSVTAIVVWTRDSDADTKGGPPRYRLEGTYLAYSDTGEITMSQYTPLDPFCNRVNWRAANISLDEDLCGTGVPGLCLVPYVTGHHTTHSTDGYVGEGVRIGLNTFEITGVKYFFTDEVLLPAPPGTNSEYRMPIGAFIWKQTVTLTGPDTLVIDGSSITTVAYSLPGVPYDPANPQGYIIDCIEYPGGREGWSRARLDPTTPTCELVPGMPGSMDP